MPLAESPSELKTPPLPPGLPLTIQHRLRRLSPTKAKLLSCNAATTTSLIIRATPSSFPKSNNPIQQVKTRTARDERPPPRAANHELYAEPGSRPVVDDESLPLVLRPESILQSSTIQSHSETERIAGTRRTRRTLAALAQLCPRKRRVHQYSPCLTGNLLQAWAACFPHSGKSRCHLT